MIPTKHSLRALLVLALLTGCGDNASQPVSRTLIKGKVIDAGTGEPIATAFVSTTPSSASVVTDAGGSYQIDVGDAGTFTVTASREGYEQRSISIQTSAGRTTVADIGLSKSGMGNNRGPLVPSEPVPADGAGAQSPSTSLGWRSSDPDGDPLAYDLYFGAVNPPTEKIASGISAMSFSPDRLDTMKTYYWKVVARDNHGGVAEGPVWRFTTSRTDSNALRFDGGGYLSVPHSSALALSGGSFTVEAWVRPGAFGAYTHIINRARSNDDADFMLLLEGSHARMQTRRLSNNILGATELKPDLWYHIAGVQDATKGKLFLYVNGQLDAETVLQGIASPSPADLLIGARDTFGSGVPSEFFTGLIQYISIWSGARSPEQLAIDMTHGPVGSEPGLLAGWALKDGTGSVAGDKGPGHYQATLNGAVRWVRAAPPVE
jgi:hypothetical protein